MIDLLECFTTIVGIESRIKTENFAFNMIFDFDSIFNVLADSLLKTVLKSDPKNYRKYDADLLLELYEAGSEDFSDSFQLQYCIRLIVLALKVKESLKDTGKIKTMLNGLNLVQENCQSIQNQEKIDTFEIPKDSLTTQAK